MVMRTCRFLLFVLVSVVVITGCAGKFLDDDSRPVPTDLVGYQVTFTATDSTRYVIVFVSEDTFTYNGVEVPAVWDYGFRGERQAVMTWVWRDSEWPVPAGEVTTIMFSFDATDCCRGLYESEYELGTFAPSSGAFRMALSEATDAALFHSPPSSDKEVSITVARSAKGTAPST